MWFDEWITRCQRVPLDLSLDLYVEELDDFREVLMERGKQLLEYILTQFGHKVRSLFVIGAPSSLLPILQLPPSSSLLALEEMSLTILGDGLDTHEGRVAFFPAKVEVLLDAPKLTRVELNNTSLLEFLGLPAEQLTSLKVNAEDVEVDPAMLVGILPRCKQLVALEICLPFEDSIGFSTTLSIFLPTLRSLEVSCFNAAHNILRCITTSLLEQLSLRYHSQDLDSLFTDLTEFQQRSSTPLSCLNLYISYGANHDMEINTEKVIGMLSLFPAIHSLEIHPRAPLHPDLLIQVVTYTEGHHVLPNLKELVFLWSFHGGGRVRRRSVMDYLACKR
ncbi:hypothetical protein BT96DRAFT_49572 [Gymnopus androsaceus JB14]|uniref:F-box domain-containing protein n=1 Tax=Gymnopus androsaceus JB14 TaxID=1447944 RepID=A0A6A4GDK0_9AGAR|nr:hypothetical protein BT96DRAFT_49572 [Gymnopus androsaceus JB14]